MFASFRTTQIHRIKIMKITPTLASTSLFALLAGPALADLTAEQVLADWKSGAEAPQPK